MSTKSLEQILAEVNHFNPLEYVGPGFNPERAERICKFIECLKVPSGVGAGKPLKLRPWQRRFIYDVYAPCDPETRKRLVRRAILSIGRKNGKGLALDTPLPTPRGWTTMGELNPGDELFDESGNICKVTFVSTDRFIDCYEMEFSNGEKITCDGDHLWETKARLVTRTIENKGLPLKNAVAVRNTRNIFDTQTMGARGDVNHSIKMPNPLVGDTIPAPIDPYLFGAWLGDGKSDCAIIYAGDEDLEHFVGAIECAGEKYTIKKDITVNNIRLSDGRGGERVLTFSNRLRKMGVFGNKHIPEEFLRASIDQRVSLLQGLMDTDGYVTKNGKQMEFCTSKEVLKNDMCELLSSLGVKYSVKEKPNRCDGRYTPGVHFVIQFCAFRDELQVFRLPRKLQRMRLRSDCKIEPRSRTLQIRCVRKVPSVVTRCIQVDSPNSLFLCGKTMIPTHNTALTAALVLTHLIGPASEVSGEVYSAATTREQAGQVFKFVAQMVRLDPELDAAQGGLLRVVDSTKTISCPRNGSFYKALSAEAGSAHGQSSSLVIYDELAQAKNRELYDVLNTSMGGRDEPLFVTISTQSRDPQHILSQLIDDGLDANDKTTICHLYEVPLDTPDIYDPRVWYLGNPALGDFRSIEDLNALAEGAKRMPSSEPTFRNLFLNQRVSSEASLISRVEWEECAASGVVLEEGEDVYAALDLSSVNDLTALVLVSAEDRDRVMPFFWKPKDVLESHSDRDFGKGNLRYVEWHKNDYLETTSGKTLDYEQIARRIAELSSKYNFLGLAYDRWRIDMLLREFDRIEFEAYSGEKGEGLKLIPWGQGYRDMDPAIDQFERAVLDKRLIHPSNPVLTWNVANAVSESDPAGNRKLNKEKAKFRIDGAVALCMALGLKYRDVVTGECGPSVYEKEDRGLLIF